MNTKQFDIATLILRSSLGVMFIAHGLLKVLVFTLPGTVQFFESVGFPGWMAYVVAYSEIGGGVLLIAGVYTRVVALAFIPILLGSLFVHIGNGWLFTNANGGWEYPAFLTIIAVVVALLGSGKYAVSLPFLNKSIATA